MKFQETELPGVIVIEPAVFEDDRGFFMETHHRDKFREAGITLPFVQDNHSRSTQGTLRGLHFQEPHAQGKLVRAVNGAIFDVAVDIRRGSPHFGRWVGVELTSENRKQMWVPPGFAHGLLVVSETADVFYKCTDVYAPDDEHIIAWNDPDIGIDWPSTEPHLSERDAGALPLAEAAMLPSFSAEGRC
jgi:dTDP-4-dehydrorhamnose 3,5-epimerase